MDHTAGRNLGPAQHRGMAGRAEGLRRMPPLDQIRPGGQQRGGGRTAELSRKPHADQRWGGRKVTGPTPRSFAAKAATSSLPFGLPKPSASSASACLPPSAGSPSEKPACASPAADGHVEEGDNVVLAVPPSVWDKIDIDPALPESLKPQMGTNVKYLAAVTRRFWKKANLSPGAHTDGDISMTWEGTDAQPGDEGAELTSFSGGPAAEACRAYSKEQRDAAYAVVLERLYPGFGKATSSPDSWIGRPIRLPAPAIPSPRSAKLRRWDRSSRGDRSPSLCR